MSAVMTTPATVGRDPQLVLVAPGRPARSLFALAATGLLCWALVQNFVNLSVPPVAVDEPVYASMGWRYLHVRSLSASASDNFEHPPLAKFLFGLAELPLGQVSITAARAVCAAAMVATAIVLACWLGRAAGRWTGLLAGAMVSLLPLRVAPQVTSFGRTAFLDPVAELFMVCSLALAWCWFHSSGRRGWLLATATGAATGLAAASKENGFLGAVGVVVLGVLWTYARSPGARGVRLIQSGVAAMTSVTVFAATYLPLGNPFVRIRFLVRFQWHQHEGGHAVGYAGRVSSHPDWWTNLWFAWHSLGPWLATALLGTAGIALLVRRDRLVAWCLAALGGPFVFHCLIAGNALPFYWVMWMPALLALSALGTRELAFAARHLQPPRWRSPATAALAAVLTCLLVAAVAEGVQVAAAPRVGGSAVANVRTALGLHGEILTAGTYLAELSPYLAGDTIRTSVPRDLGGIDTVLIGQPRCRTLINRAVRALVAANLAAGTMHEVYTDRLVQVYVVTYRLQAPSRAQIEAQSAGQVSDHC